MLNVYAECRYAECRYAECRCAECRYAECHYAECSYAGYCGASTIAMVFFREILFFSKVFLNSLMEKVNTML